MKRRESVNTMLGFTLIEIAIVLVIIGLMVGMGAKLMGPLTQRAKLYETKEVLNAAAESLISYGASNNALPDTSNFASKVRKSTDVWSKSLYYVLDSNLTDNTIGGICGRKSTNLTLEICPDATCSSPTETISNVAFIILSGGPNLNNQTSGTDSVTSSTTVKTYDIGIVVDDYTTDMNRSEAYDDVVKWISLDELRIKAGCLGAPLRVVNNELPYGYVSSEYSGTVFADGGVPYTTGGGKYRWCREESASTGLTFTPSTSSTDCAGLTESLWTQADELVISSSPSTAGSFSITVFVRDDNDDSGSNDNIVQKTMVLTVNPASGSSCTTSCSSFRVWNDSGEKRDFYIDGDCRKEDDGDEITNDSSRQLDSGETITRYNSDDESCSGGVAETLTFDSAKCSDTDGDCDVYISGSDK